MVPQRGVSGYLSLSLSHTHSLSRPLEGNWGKTRELTIRLARSCRRGPPSPSRNQRPAASIPLWPPSPPFSPFRRQRNWSLGRRGVRDRSFLDSSTAPATQWSPLSMPMPALLPLSMSVPPYQ
ncbi:hypothetical protein LZ31DRAFT_289269 [Colletotrichum somersetense]|nr:hypothetical protein LZ31DRAFT_289269 [Colletotrichum somersetense]